MKKVDTHSSRLNAAWRGVMNISEVYLQTILEKAVRNAFPKTISLLSAEQRKHTERQNHQKTYKLKNKVQKTSVFYIALKEIRKKVSDSYEQSRKENSW